MKGSDGQGRLKYLRRNAKILSTALRYAYPTRAGDLPGVIVQRDRNAAGSSAVCARHRPQEGVVGRSSV